MKKIKLNTARLQLRKEKISELTSDQQNAIAGGATETCNPTFGCPSISGCYTLDCSINCSDNCVTLAGCPGTAICP